MKVIASKKLEPRRKNSDGHQSAVNGWLFTVSRKRLKFFDFFEVVVRDIEEKDSNYNTDNRRPKYLSTKIRVLNNIKYVPNASPNNNQSNDNGKCPNKVFKILMLLFFHFEIVTYY